MGVSVMTRRLMFVMTVIDVPVLPVTEPFGGGAGVVWIRV